jgi:hypothetical protein
MFLQTPKRHFDEDLARARELLAHARSLAPGVLQDDVLRAAWMMAVGASDAYFSDAYGDLLARTLRAKQLEPAVAIPDRLNNLKVPVIAILRDANSGWRWRMAARELIEEENVLSLEKVKKLFNHFFRDGHKILNTDTIANFITHRDAKSRTFGITGTRYRRLTTSADQNRAKKAAVGHMQDHFEEIFQRRHDCIHNCDRPKIALQGISPEHAGKAIEDIHFLVARCNEAFLAEFPVYLTTLGFGAVTRNRVLQ